MSNTIWRGRNRYHIGALYGDWHEIDLDKPGSLETWKKVTVAQQQLHELQYYDKTHCVWQSWPDCEPVTSKWAWQCRTRTAFGQPFSMWRSFYQDNVSSWVDKAQANPLLVQVRVTHDGGLTWAKAEHLTADNSAREWFGRIAGGSWVPVPLDLLPVWLSAVSAEPAKFALRRSGDPVTITQQEFFEAALQADLVYPGSEDAGDAGEFFFNADKHDNLTAKLEAMARRLGIFD